MRWSVPQNTDPYEPYLRLGYVLAFCILAVSGIEWIRNFGEPISRDFISFWGAARLALAGTPALAYDNAALHAVQVKVAAFDNGEMPFPYPPAFLLLIMPFAVLPFPLALALWSFATLSLYALVARQLAPQSRWLAVAFPPVFVIAALGQNGFITAALFLGGLTLLHRERRFAAGMVLGCLILKPQLALMLPVAMLAGREWKVIAGALFSATAVILAGLVIFGAAASMAWLQQMQFYMHIAREGLVGWHKLVSVYAAGRQAGLPENAAIALHGAVAVVAACLVARSWRSHQNAMTKAGVLGAATMLASPYLYLYDALILIPAFICLVQRRASVALVGALWLLPIVLIVQAAEGNGPVGLGPLLPILLLARCVIPARTGAADHVLARTPSDAVPV